MPTTVCGPGARGTIAAGHFAARGHETLAVMASEDKAIVDDAHAAADSASTASTIQVCVSSHATAVPLPVSKTGGHAHERSGLARTPFLRVVACVCVWGIVKVAREK